MPHSMTAPCLQVHATPLTQGAFESFGTVVENQGHADLMSSSTTLPYNAISVNQGTATKYIDVTHILNHYDTHAPSRRAGKAVMNMFVCKPRELRRNLTPEVGSRGLFDIKILECHPFTTQTFIPLGLARDDPYTQYMVIVAPQLEKAPDGVGKHPGLPDVNKIKAFVANGSQAVTYGAGTWHAPMVVLGQSIVEFVVVQYANGVAEEDCQEVEIRPKPNAQEGLAVAIEGFDTARSRL
ncbi:MAG: Ureidoglycolate lyase [Candelina submexicana]|nr:MAG: Ureidoglycolate lyase [Candelina submexicana]